MSQTRDRDLPDYASPPINEVVLGVQYLTPPGYSQLFAGQVWDLYRTRYPQFDVQPPLSPEYEIFGGPNPNQFFQAPFRIGPSANHERFWFISEDKTELLQFQQDRLMHNWREIPGLKNEYPRFENILGNFENELRSLNEFMASISSGQKLQINQCEVGYINHLPISDKKADFWINLFNFEKVNPENLTFIIPEILTNESGNPFARLVIEAYSGIKATTGERIISLNLTVRGAPRDGSIEASSEFLTQARKIIINRFSDITTESAHAIWGRNQ